eukprot:15380861-Heterocapsa_arctica.AAC.1
MSVDVKSGLIIRPQYEQLIGAAVSDDNRNIKFPNRDAKFVRNGFVLSQLDGEGMRAMERQQQQAGVERFKQGLVQQAAESSGIAATMFRAANKEAGVQAGVAR